MWFDLISPCFFASCDLPILVNQTPRLAEIMCFWILYFARAFLSYSCLFPIPVRILKFKQALTQLLLLQICVKENLVWFVLLLLRCVPPQLSCSNDRRVQHSRDPASRLSLAASDLLPHRRQPWKLHYHHQPSRWPRGLYGSAIEVALFRVGLRYASLRVSLIQRIFIGSLKDWNP